MNLTEQQLKQLGLQFLLKRANPKSRDRYRVPAIFEKHPFDLTVPPHDNNKWFLIKYVGWPGYTDISINNTATLFGEMIVHYSLVEGKITHLRVIFAECDPENLKNHDVYYEIGTKHEIFITGGCTDCSGAGKEGKQKMDGVFAFLSDLYDVKIERADIPYQTAKKCRENIEEAVESSHLCYE